MPEPRMLSAQPSHEHVLARSLPYLRPHGRVVAGGLVLSLAASAGASSLPPLIGRASDAVLAGDRPELNAVATVVLVVAVVQAVLERQAAVLLALGGERTVRDLRHRAVERLASVDLRFLEAHRTGDLLRRTTTEIADLAAFVRDHLAEVLGGVATVVFTTAVLLLTSLPLSAVAAVVFLPPATALMRGFRRRADAVYAHRAAVDAEIAAGFAETVEAREALLTPADVGLRIERIASDGDRAVEAVRRVVRVYRWVTAMDLVEGVTLAALAMTGVLLVRAGRADAGDVVTFVIAGRTLFAVFSDLTSLVAAVQEARTGLARVLDLLESTAPAPARTSGSANGRAPSGDLVVENVSYGYGEEAVLHDVTLTIPEGARLGIVGPTGAGKTTLAKLLAGLYLPDTGRIRHAGDDLADLSPADLRQRVVLIPQDVHLIDGTLAENIALVPGQPDHGRIEDVVTGLGLREWVLGLPGGLDTPVGPRGRHLSAGERQMAGLVRACLLDPAVLVLDEATADVDPQAARLLESAVARLAGNRTVVVIAHRPSTIEALPWVVALSDGRVLT